MTRRRPRKILIPVTLRLLALIYYYNNIIMPNAAFDETRGEDMGATGTETLWLEDLAVGQEFLSEGHSLDQRQIIDFATEFDPQPFHLDPVAAEQTFFRGLAASGWHTMALTMKLLVQSMPFARGIIGAGGEISWPRPTRPGDILRVKSRITEIKPSLSRPDRGMVTTHSVTLNQRDEVLQELSARLVAFRREG